ncbi:glycosyl transferase [Pilimelia terevasa]|uniref:Glycosyl transferase n=1 Tax=Pilimelia terevasa TaxID=53372 RepID=A0A8J3BVT9_9ACTN|nr:glycosyl transferase [Pilimelia terevasa]
MSCRVRDQLRVALVAPPYYRIPPVAYGGIENVVADLANALVGRGHRITLIGAGPSLTAAPMESVWPDTIGDRLGDTFPELIHAARSRRAVQRLVREKGLDVVHDHTGAGPLNAAVYAAMGLPTVVTMHGPVEADTAGLYRALADSIHLVAISDRQRQLAPDLPWLRTVHNAVRLADWPYRAEAGSYALFLGRFNRDKAPHLAVEAAHAAGVPLILAGRCSDPAEKAYFAAEVRPRLGPGDTMFGIADAAAKRTLLAGARCLVMPVQWEEPFGMVMVEAMACGTPVVALRHGAVPEVVAHGVTGFVVDHPHELAAALRRIGDIDRGACRDRVRRLFDVSRLAVGYEAAYREALAARVPVAPERTFLLPAEPTGIVHHLTASSSHRGPQRSVRPTSARPGGEGRTAG